MVFDGSFQIMGTMYFECQKERILILDIMGSLNLLTHFLKMNE